MLRARARRAGVSMVEMADAYTALGRGFGVARNDFARALPDGDEPTWNAATNRRWARLRKAARDFLAGRVGTPCRGSVHMGSRTLQPDRRRAAKAISEGKWRPVECSQDTVHAYYALTVEHGGEAGRR